MRRKKAAHGVWIFSFNFSLSPLQSVRKPFPVFLRRRPRKALAPLLSARNQSTMAHFHKPEHVLMRAEELIRVGQKQVALDSMHGQSKICHLSPPRRARGAPTSVHALRRGAARTSSVALYLGCRARRVGFVAVLPLTACGWAWVAFDCDAAGGVWRTVGGSTGTSLFVSL